MRKVLQNFRESLIVMGTKDNKKLSLGTNYLKICKANNFELQVQFTSMPPLTFFLFPIFSSYKYLRG